MIRWKSWCRREPAEREVARFGMGRLVRCGTNRYELRGGDARDLAEAREWAAHFLHAAFIEHPSASAGAGGGVADMIPATETSRGGTSQAVRTRPGGPCDHPSRTFPLPRVDGGRAR